MKRFVAYIALYCFYRDYNLDAKNKDLALLLDRMKLGDDRKSKDPSILQYWLDICPEGIEEKQAFGKGVDFMRFFANQLQSKDLSSFLDRLGADTKCKKNFEENYLCIHAD